MYLSPVKLIVIALLVGFFMHSCTSKQASKYPYTFEEWAGGGKTRLLIKQDGKYGYAGLDSSIVIPMEYDSALYFNLNAYTLVQKDGQWGVIDENGRIVVDCAYDSIQAYDKTGAMFKPYYVAVKNENYALLDTTGRLVLHNYPFLKCLFCKRAILAMFDEGYGLVDTSGNKLTSSDYKHYEQDGSQTWYTLKKNSKWELFNWDGKPILQPLDSISLQPKVYYKIMHSGSDEFVYLAKENGLWGAINEENEWIIPNKYAAISYDEQESEFVLTPVQ